MSTLSILSLRLPMLFSNFAAAAASLLTSFTPASRKATSSVKPGILPSEASISAATVDTRAKPWAKASCCRFRRSSTTPSNHWSTVVSWEISKSLAIVLSLLLLAIASCNFEPMSSKAFAHA